MFTMDSSIPLAQLSPSTSLSDSDPAPVLTLSLELFTRSARVADLSSHASNMANSFEEALLKGSLLSMLPNFSIDPTGDEQGDFLVIDLGGSTLRVAVISITPPQEGISREDRIRLVSSRKWRVENSNKFVDENFFAWIGGKIKETLASQTVILADSVITTGLTWSFQMESKSHNSASLLYMGKGYEVDEAVFGRDLKELLETSVLRHGLRINVESIINDSLAVYAAGCFADSKTKLAVVLGTGLNVCCLLNMLSQIHPLKQLAAQKRCLFNTETSMFGRELISDFANKYDVIIDSRFLSVPDFAPHMTLDPLSNDIFQPSELLASGRYLPELVRLVMVEMMEKGEMFVGQKNVEMLLKPYEGVTGEFMCFIHECDDYALVASKVETFYGWTVGLVVFADVLSLKLLVEAVARRAAYIVAVVIVAYIKLLATHNGQFGNEVITIGYVGSVLAYFTRMREMIRSYVNTCSYTVDLGIQVELQEVHESSIVGAAIGAACHVK